MVDSIIKDVKQSFQQGNMMTRIIIVNVFVWIIAALVVAFTPDVSASNAYDSSLIRNLALHSELIETLKRPWVLITHMFLHIKLWHILWNMLIFYWFARIVGDFIGDDKILPIYLLGGLMGVAFFSLGVMLVGVKGLAWGASAAILSFPIAAAVLSPEYRIHLIFLGPVKIMYIALFIILMDVIGSASSVNQGGHIAHLGGAFFGWLYVTLLRKGTDLTAPINDYIIFPIQNMLNRSPNTRPKKKKQNLTITHRKKANQQRDQEPNLGFQDKVDAILEKIKENGYESLTKEEKEFLFQASKK